MKRKVSYSFKKKESLFFNLHFIKKPFQKLGQVDNRISNISYILSDDMAGKQEEIIQWKISLPEDIWDYIFLNYCDFESVVTSRDLQSTYVKSCTISFDFKEAISANNLNNLKWIYQSTGVLTGLFLDQAVEYGHFNIVNWLREVGCAWSEMTFVKAARCGDLERIKWLKANECSWNCKTFAAAAER